jgi:hypothetical protein
VAQPRRRNRGAEADEGAAEAGVRGRRLPRDTRDFAKESAARRTARAEEGFGK